MLKSLDLFSGIGGFTYALEQTGGFKTAAFCEIEKYPKRVLRKHWPEIPIYDDVRELTAERLAADGIAVDVVTGGFPCQDISIGGSGEGIRGQRSMLWREFARITADVRPRFAIVENVFALRGRGLSDILGHFASVGYDAVWTEFDTQYFGLPQRRRRVYIVAARDGLPAGSDVFQFAERSGSRTARRLAAFEHKLQCDCETLQEGWQSFAYFTRQRSDDFAVKGLSSTLTKRDYKDFTDVVWHDGVLRRVMPPERLRLQGFPSDFCDGVGASKGELFRMTGMSVPVVRHIGQRIIDELL